MYRQELERYDGDLDAIVNDVIAYAIKSVGEIGTLDGKPMGEPVNVLFDLSISEDQDVPPSEAYFKRVDEVQTQTRWLAINDTTDAIVDRLKAGLALVANVGNLISFSVTTWKGTAR